MILALLLRLIHEYITDVMCECYLPDAWNRLAVFHMVSRRAAQDPTQTYIIINC